MNTAQQIAELIKYECEKRDVYVSEALKAAGIKNNNMVLNAKNGRTPNITDLTKLSVFWDLPLDYFTGTEHNEKSLSPEKEKLLSLYESLPEPERAKLLEFADLLIAARRS